MYQLPAYVFCAIMCVCQPLQPFVHIWDSNTLVTLQQIGLGTFERGVGSVAFSNSVSIASHYAFFPVETQQTGRIERAVHMCKEFKISKKNQ